MTSGTMGVLAAAVGLAVLEAARQETSRPPG